MARFEKGRSGNPGGRPKVVGEVRELAQAYTTEAIETLVAIMADGNAPPAARVAASNAILDRGYGRPAQTVNAQLTGNRGIYALTREELMVIAAGGLTQSDHSENRMEQESDELLPSGSRQKSH
jgi:hypothetical protein